MRAAFRIYTRALHCASWMVPDDERLDWVKEWKAELWHVSSRTSHRQTAAFVAGAFQDALCLGADGLIRRKAIHPFRSPVLCLSLLLFIALAAAGLALVLPGTRTMLLPLPYTEARNLVVVSRDRSPQDWYPNVKVDEYQHWKKDARHIFSDLAFYQVVKKQLHAGHGVTVELMIAHATDNLPFLLDTSLFPAHSALTPDMSRLVLSDAAWRQHFHADLHLVGRTVYVMGEKAIVIGVAKPNAWRLPGKVEAWLVESANRTDRFSAYTEGFVVARMQPSITKQHTDGNWHMLVPNAGGGYDSFACVPVEELSRQPLIALLFPFMLALLALPATTSLPLGEYPVHPRQQPWSLRLRRWIFLTAKLAFGLPAICFTSLDLSYLPTSMQPEDSLCLQICLSFIGMLAALRWMLRDQRRRCPVCLQVLRNPVHVGQPTRNFLAWNGTELICVVGHGLLHVPEIPTSWFSTQRWLYLDPSWRPIFRPEPALHAS